MFPALSFEQTALSHCAIHFVSSYTSEADSNVNDIILTRHSIHDGRLKTSLYPPTSDGMHIVQISFPTRCIT